MPDPSFVNFIAKCLEWDPKKRLSPDEGLQHEWIIKGLPPNIILHNPHNNPYSRSNQNSSEQYQKTTSTASKSQRRQPSAKQRADPEEASQRSNKSKPKQLDSRNLEKKAVLNSSLEQQQQMNSSKGYASNSSRSTNRYNSGQRKPQQSQQ